MNKTKMAENWQNNVQNASPINILFIGGYIRCHKSASQEITLYW